MHSTGIVPRIGRRRPPRVQGLDGILLWGASHRLVATLACSARLAWAGLEPAGILLEGTAAATPWYEVRGPAAGPTVVIVAGAHGDEIAGPIAAEQIARWPLRRGRLRVLPRANVRALEAIRRYTPDEPSALSNLNRNYPTSQRPEPRGELATAIFEWVRAAHPNWLLDLHEGRGIHATDRSSVGRTLIISHSPVAHLMATQMWRRVHTTVPNPDLPFTMVASGGVTGGLSRAAWELLNAHSMTLETAKGDPLALRVRQHRSMVHELLQRLEMIGPEADPTRPLPPCTSVPEVQPPRRIAVYAGPSADSGAVHRAWFQLRGAAGRLAMPIDAVEICAGALAAFDALLVPDEPSAAPGALGAELDAAVRVVIREFVRGGGGYLGWGAGARIALERAPDLPRLVPAKVRESAVNARPTTARVVLTERALPQLGPLPAGPMEMVATLLFQVTREEGLTPVTVWAVAEGPDAEPTRAVAIAARHGEGRVVLWGFDLTAAPAWLVATADWSAGRDRSARSHSSAASAR